jgi:hypothetical protein
MWAKSHRLVRQQIPGMLAFVMLEPVAGREDNVDDWTEAFEVRPCMACSARCSVGRRRAARLRAGSRARALSHAFIDVNWCGRELSVN